MKVEIYTEKLKKPLILLFSTLLFSILISWLTLFVKQSQTSNVNLAREELELQRTEFRSAIEAGSIMQTSQRRFADLELRNFVGEEQRLLWVESLRNQGRNQKLFDLEYKISQQQPLNPTDLASSTFQLYASHMQLSMDLPHEGKLISFLNDLEDEMPAIYQLQACSIRSSIESEGLNFDEPNVSAKCNLLWFTVRPMEKMESDGMDDA